MPDAILYNNRNNFVAYGGDNTLTISGVKIHVFRQSGTFQILSGAKNISYLIVGGGGGGGGAKGGATTTCAGGGGGGTVIVGTTTLGAGSNIITVGNGGAGGVGASGVGSQGQSSSINNIVATGGAGGGTSGGASNSYIGGTNYIADAYWGAGGGAGAGSNGTNGTYNSGGVGGVGISNSLIGTSTYYAGGGGGGIYQLGSAGAGGLGGGGSGIGTNGNGGNGTPNTGGGGGGAGATGGGSSSDYTGGVGGSGIVVIAYNVVPRFDISECQLLADIIVSGSAVTQIDITGLNLVKGEEYVLVSQFTNTSAVTVSLRLMFNENYTLTNYYSQELYADGTTIGAIRVNNPTVLGALSGITSFINSKIKLTNNGYIVVQNDIENRIGVNSNAIASTYHTTTFTATAITSLRINTNSANAIGIGSRFQLYRSGGV